MKQRHQRDAQQTAEILLDIPLDQLLPDPNQPRKNFDQTSLQELARSIDSQGLQQRPVVNFAYSQEGKHYYYIKAGERRYHAHVLLKRATMSCIVEIEKYDGTESVDRKLAQAAENSSRAPHTHTEIIAVMQDVVIEEIAKKADLHDGSSYGAIESALKRVSDAFGKSIQWARNYYDLSKLRPELQALLDGEEDEHISFNIGIALSRAPMMEQQKLWKEAKALKDKGGHELMLTFITRKARELQCEHHKYTARNRKPSDDKAVIINTVRLLYRKALAFCAERHSTEHQMFIVGALEQCNAIEVDELLHKLREAKLVFDQLQQLATERREILYKPYKANSPT